MLVIVLLSLENPDWWPFYQSWILGLKVEIVSLILSISYHRPSNLLDIAQTGLKVGHIILIVSLLALYYVNSRRRNWKSRNDEVTPLLTYMCADSHGTTITDNDNMSTPVEVAEEDIMEEGEETM